MTGIFIRRWAGVLTAFAAMLAQAVEDHPAARLVIKCHPETLLGLRKGHFAAPLPPNTSLCADPVSPWALLEGAIAVYTVSSQMGFEAVLAGHRPKVFGQPFYAGWGLTDDQSPIPRRKIGICHMRGISLSTCARQFIDIILQSEKDKSSRSSR